jgi:hypothetical protein
MPDTVQLDNKACLVAVEIDHEASDGTLTAKMESAESVCP